MTYPYRLEIGDRGFKQKSFGSPFIMGILLKEKLTQVHTILSKSNSNLSSFVLA
jgi:hypothetical protein